jgi:hypothetical protein
MRISKKGKNMHLLWLFLNYVFIISIFSHNFSNTPPHQLGDHVNVKRPFRANSSTSANSNSRENSLNRSYSQDAATAMHRSYNTQDSTANHKAMNRSYIQDSTTAVNNVMNRSYIQDSTTAVNSVMNRSFVQDSTTAAVNNVMNRSFSQDSSAGANAKQRQESAAVNGAASGGRSKKLAIGGGPMSRSLVQESTSADRRSIDESLALIQHHVQVASFFSLIDVCSCSVPTLPLFPRAFFNTVCVLIYVYGIRHCIELCSYGVPVELLQLKFLFSQDTIH